MAKRKGCVLGDVVRLGIEGWRKDWGKAGLGRKGYCFEKKRTEEPHRTRIKTPRRY